MIDMPFHSQTEVKKISGAFSRLIHTLIFILKDARGGFGQKFLPFLTQ